MSPHEPMGACVAAQNRYLYVYKHTDVYIYIYIHTLFIVYIYRYIYVHVHIYRIEGYREGGGVAPRAHGRVRSSPEEVEVRRQSEQPEQREREQRRWLQQLGTPVPAVRGSSDERSAAMG